MLIESLALDMEDVRLSLARGFNFPAEHSGIPCLSGMLDFIEKGDYHPLWYTDPGTDDPERRKRERSFDICKAAIVKVVVEVAGEEKNEEVLWDDSDKGGEFVKRMVRWIKDDVAKRELVAQQASRGVTDGLASVPDSHTRDDLVICATLSLGNLARRGMDTLHSHECIPEKSLNTRTVRDDASHPASFAGTCSGLTASARSRGRCQTQARCPRAGETSCTIRVAIDDNPRRYDRGRDCSTNGSQWYMG